MPRNRSTLARQRGYAILLMMVLVTMGVLFAVVNQLSALKWSRAQGGTVALNQAKDALLAYAITYRENDSDHDDEVFGYLPCPDTDGDGSADTPCGTAGYTVAGLLPYKTLDLPDLRDSAAECLWYVVSGSFKNSPKAISTTNPNGKIPMNWDTQGQIALLDSTGTIIVTPGDTNGGVAAVIIAANAALSGQSRTSSVHTCGAVPSQVAAYLDGNYALPNSGTVQLTQGNIDGNSNNDQILYLTPKEIWDRVKKRGDRGGINAFIGDLSAKLSTAITADQASGSTPSCYNQPGSGKVSSPPCATSFASYGSGKDEKQVGEIPLSPYYTTASDNDLPDDNYRNHFDNWRNQFRYVVCGDVRCGKCQRVNNRRCAAALFFGSESSTGAPRASQPTALSDLFESDGALPALTTQSGAFSGDTAYSSGSDDIGACAAPPFYDTDLNFSCDLEALLLGAKPLASGNKVITVNPTTITLGQIGDTGGAATSELFGCVWSNEALTLGDGLRTYFNFTTADISQGFVFALIDAARNPIANAPCGESSGGRLGYSGDNGTTDPLLSPKIGVEFDTSQNLTRGDPATYTRHAAIVYWGASAIDDDNNHGAPAVAETGNPVNPSGSPGVSSNLGPSGNGKMASGSQTHVRIDIVRSDEDADTKRYAIKVWLVLNSAVSSVQLADMKDLTQDFASSTYGSTLSPDVSDDQTMDDNAGGAASQAMTTIRLGFTTAQTASNPQEITISDLASRIR